MLLKEQYILTQFLSEANLPEWCIAIAKEEKKPQLASEIKVIGTLNTGDKDSMKVYELITITDFWYSDSYLVAAESKEAAEKCYYDTFDKKRSYHPRIKIDMISETSSFKTSQAFVGSLWLY